MAIIILSKRMSQITIYFLGFISSLTCYSQNNPVLKVSYDYTDSYYSLEEQMTTKATLVATPTESIYTNYKKEFAPGTVSLNDNDQYTGVKLDAEIPLYKDFKSRNIYCYSNINYQKKSILKDSLDLFKWILIPGETKKILNYMCHAATTNFRGRNYKVYFTYDVPFRDGPWKLNGLPGLILEAVDQDNRTHYKAYELSITNEDLSIENPFKGEKTSNWDEIIEKAKRIFQTKKELIENKYNGKITTDFSENIEVYDLNKN
ncbi:GLPGLI family protein [Leeuwenhoekiella aequorea]|uniref:GLPGLI family protein n=1 Tax=Leeuwenhoekiella TaxID=283735 RepID=UPI00352E07D4|tara:strand:- start:3730 stop:4512 length:783 start_codon:yes stop_codon:yes gene_type:complete